MTASEAVILLANEAERLGGSANDEDGIVRAVVHANGLGPAAWFCVCCELAEREARRQGFAGEVERALHVAEQRLAARRPT